MKSLSTCVNCTRYFSDCLTSGCLFLLLIMVRPPLFAQPGLPSVNIETLTVEDGLSQSIVYSIAQDVKGFIWIAIFTGLYRYDGNEFVHFRHGYCNNFSIFSNRIYRLPADSKERLRAGT